MSVPTAPTVFLSTVTADLGDWRDVLHAAFSRAGCRVLTQKHTFGASAGGVPELLRKHIDESDFVVHLAGLVYGWEPEAGMKPLFDTHPGFRCSYTQFEYYYAHQQHKKVIALVCAENFPYASTTEVGDTEEDRAARRELQFAHRKRVAEGFFHGTPLEGHRSRPLSETVTDVKALLQVVAAAVGTMHNGADAKAELLALAEKRHEELLALITAMPARVADELERRGLVRPAVERTHDISRIVRYAPPELVGRDAELTLITDTWERAVRGQANRPRVLTFVALGGEGKTSLVAKWAVDLADRGWPDCPDCFAWSFYSQGSDEKTATSSDLFLNEALTALGDADDRTFAASNAGADAKGRRLARVLARRRVLLILDGLEPLQYAPTTPTRGELRDGGLLALLRGLATDNPGLCVCTTRYSVASLQGFFRTSVREVPLERLSRAAGVHLLRSFGVWGSERRTVPFGSNPGERVNAFESLVEDVKGHALTLNLLGSYLRDAHAGDIRRRDLVKLSDADDEQGGHAFRVMEAYAAALASEGKNGPRVLAVLRLMGLFDRPATADCLNALWKPPAIAGLTDALVGLTEAERNVTFTRLETARLLTVNRTGGAKQLTALDAHPLVREYFARRVREHLPDAWRAAHRRLFEHLRDSTQEGDAPTLEQLQPLYQAVAHGCHAGLQQAACETVYYARIGRGKEGYSARKLGAFGSDLGAVAGFFETPWIRVSPALTDIWQSWLLGEAAFRLRALGRLTEALEPMRAGLERAITAENWNESARRANNLSELEQTLGLLGEPAASGVEDIGAVADAARAVTFADRSGDAFLRAALRTAHADALHQAGRRADAEALFRAAEQLQAEHQPEYPLLYSVQGFQYCDLLLTAAERAAWERAQGGVQKADGLTACRAVSARAVQTLKWMTDANFGHLSIALNHLTLGRAGLFEAVLAGPGSGVARAELNASVSGLRRAGTTHHLPRGLLTRAWLRALDGHLTGPDSAREDLDEAWEVAERGPMRLFMADIHLYRARLFYRHTPYPWDSPEADLRAAETLITDCGYHRRDEELADAKRLILGTT